jgi:hypothetical protein
MGIHVLLLTRYGRMGASSRLRFLQYLTGLDEYDIDVHPAPFLDDVYLRELYEGRRPSMGRIFSFYSERLRQLVKAREYDVVWIEKEVLPWVPHWVGLTGLGSLPLVIDFDDAWHLRYRFLESWVEEAGAKHVTCIPTVVDLRRYPEGSVPPPCPSPSGGSERRRPRPISTPSRVS